MLKTILEEIAHDKFRANELQVEQLAQLIVSGQKATGTYHSILLGHLLAEFGDRPRKPSPAAARALLELTHKRLYPHVLKGLGFDDSQRVERDRLATFARTAASDMRHFINKGGDVRKLDPATLRKSQLRRVGRKVPTGTRAQKAFERSVGVIQRSALRIAAQDQRDAAHRVKKAIRALEQLLETIADQPKPDARKAKTARARPTRAAVENRLH